MPEKWIPLPLDKPLFANLDPEAVVGAMTAIENGFINEQGGHTRFPGLREVADIPDGGRVYLHDFNGDLMGATDKGGLYRINRAYNVETIGGVPISGGRRTIFQKTDRELLMAAGGPIVRFRDREKEILSKDAPLASHVGWIDNITAAVEINSGRFYNSPPGQPDVWNPLDTFSADGNPDNINSLIITPYRELMLTGKESIEQFERLTNGTVPFFRRWAVGDGVKFPYVSLFADNALWTINALTELVRFSGQVSQAQSGEVGLLLESIDDWRDAWLGGFPDKPLHILGQKFMVLQAPHATNSYGTKGVTLAFDYKNKRFFSLYGWDDIAGVPARWPGWSHWPLWNKVFVGGTGKIYEMTAQTYRHGSGLQRWLIRTSHIAEGSDIQLKNLRLQIKRGIGSNTSAPTIRVRCRRNGRAFGSWVTRSLGRAGDTEPFIYFGHFGTGSTFMFEISSSDDCAIDLQGAQALVEPVGH